MQENNTQAAIDAAKEIVAAQLQRVREATELPVINGQPEQ